MGTVVILEAARRIKRLSAITYASSSSVYGGNRRQPSSIDDPVNQPVSLYAASKASCELIAHSYSHFYGFPATGLRYFTTYGPWGRPDMATWLFTEAIIAGRPIKVFNKGQMARDFTYIDDIVAGTLAAHDRPADLGRERQPDTLSALQFGQSQVGKAVGFYRGHRASARLRRKQGDVTYAAR